MSTSLFLGLVTGKAYGLGVMLRLTRRSGLNHAGAVRYNHRQKVVIRQVLIRQPGIIHLG